MKKFVPLFLLFLSFGLKGQVYTYSMNQTSMNGQPGDGFYWNITFSNPSSSSITVGFDRYLKNNPPYWYSCFCYIQCNPPSLDYVDIELAPNSSSLLAVFFKTDSVNPGQASASIRFYELGFASDADTVHLLATTMGPVSIKSIANEGLHSFPNPTGGEFTFIALEGLPYELMITDVVGKIIYHRKGITDKSHTIQLGDQPKGEYFLKVVYSSGKTENKKILKN